MSVSTMSPGSLTGNPPLAVGCFRVKTRPRPTTDVCKRGIHVVGPITEGVLMSLDVLEPATGQQFSLGARPPASAVVGSDVTVSCERGVVRYANFDYAASAPAFTAVADEIARCLPEYASVHRGAGQLSQRTTARYEGARDTVRTFVGARDDDHVIFTRNTTDAVNLLASTVPGDTVVLDIEHHANLLPWSERGRRVVRGGSSVAATVNALAAELHRTPAALLAVTGASNVTGEVLPIHDLARVAHRAGARILVDAAQLAPHRPVDISGDGSDDSIDYLVFSGHKLYAPFGAGVLVGRADWLDAADPYLAGGGATAHVGVDDVRWRRGPARHEAGSPNVLGTIAIASACRELETIGFAAVIEHERALTRRLDDGLDDIAGVTRLRMFADAPDRVGIAAFTVDDVAPRRVAEILGDTYGIGVRDGRFCAHPFLERLGCSDGAVRASLGIGTVEDDVDRLLDALSAIAA